MKKEDLRVLKNVVAKIKESGKGDFSIISNTGFALLKKLIKKNEKDSIS